MASQMSIRCFAKNHLKICATQEIKYCARKAQRTFSFLPQSTLQFRLRSTPLPDTKYKIQAFYSSRTSCSLQSHCNKLHYHFSSHKDLQLQQVHGHSSFPLAPPNISLDVSIQTKAELPKPIHEISASRYPPILA